MEKTINSQDLKILDNVYTKFYLNDLEIRRVKNEIDACDIRIEELKYKVTNGGNNLIATLGDKIIENENKIKVLNEKLSFLEKEKNTLLMILEPISEKHNEVDLVVPKTFDNFKIVEPVIKEKPLEDNLEGSLENNKSLVADSFKKKVISISTYNKEKIEDNFIPSLKKAM